MPAQLDFLDYARRESGRFATVLADADPSRPVPSCPDWDAADLVWHLTEVQLFWGAIVRDRLADPGPAQAAMPERAAQYPALLAQFREASAALIAALDDTADNVSMWTWSDDHSAGFIRRRQAHEALIHRLDAELTTGSLSAVDPALATDGVNEALRFMYGGSPAWGTFTPGPGTGRIATADTGSQWFVQLGRFRGTSPSTGTTYDDPSLQVVEGGTSPATFSVTASARDLDAWLWNRPPLEDITVEGTGEHFEEFRAIVAEGVQ